MTQQLYDTRCMRGAATVPKDNCVDTVDVKDGHLDPRLRDGAFRPNGVPKLDVEVGIDREKYGLLKIDSAP